MTDIPNIGALIAELRTISFHYGDVLDRAADAQGRQQADLEAVAMAMRHLIRVSADYYEGEYEGNLWHAIKDAHEALASDGVKAALEEAKDER